jgi:hypothetical protein
MKLLRNPAGPFRVLLVLGAASMPLRAEIKGAQPVPTSVRLARAVCSDPAYSVPAKEANDWQCEIGWVTLYVQNTSAKPAKVEVSSLARYANGGEIQDLKAAASATIQKGETRPVWVQIRYRKPSTQSWYPAAAFTIQLQVTGDDGSGPPSIVLLPLAVQTAPPLLLGSLLLWSALVVAAAAVLIGILSLGKSDWMWLKDPVGPPSFNPAASMASAFAIAATILTSFLGFTGIPGTVSHMSRNSYTALSLIFAAFILAAPLVFNSIRELVPVPIPDPNDPANTSGFGFQGFLGMYVLSTILNLWGVLGQIGLILLLVDEIQLAEILAKSAVTTVHSALTILLVLLTIYAVRTVRQQSRKSAAYAGAVAAHGAAVRALAPGVPVPPLPRVSKWTML